MKLMLLGAGLLVGCYAGFAYVMCFGSPWRADQ